MSKVYQVEDKDGNRQANYSTGTRVYTRKSNAIKKLHLGTNVVEY